MPDGTTPSSVKPDSADPIGQDQTLNVRIEFGRQLGPQDAELYRNLAAALEAMLRGISTADARARSTWVPVGATGIAITVPGPLDGAIARKLDRGLRGFARAVRYRPGGAPNDLEASVKSVSLTKKG
jgi:hypothetical protein